MATYLGQISYTPAAWAALVRNPVDRSDAIRGPIEKLGGTMKEMWMAFGQDDAVGIMEMPDNIAAAALSMAIMAGGACKEVKITPLISMAEGVEALKKAAECGYRPAQSGTAV